MTTPLFEDQPEMLNTKVAAQSRKAKCNHCGARTTRTVCDDCRCTTCARIKMLCECRSNRTTQERAEECRQHGSGD